jgi:hypothetical protein
MVSWKGAVATAGSSHPAQSGLAENFWNQLTLFVDGGISYSRPEKHTHLSYLILQEKLPPMDIRDQDFC